ncbi:zona pellucida sperm-binding protein 3-like [Gadus chalcogrammus]|uniref:zona pellucida sperm-binding protein 3-like n=1 Tax=Gadus chalcogrammus TaxID=1042646 RepID=UPI0024C2D63E|nr:zona pellucida sperm-binding protein 3-like [Gadus chalcogrammus]
MKTSTPFLLLTLLSSAICIPPSLALHPLEGKQTFTQQETFNGKGEHVETVAVSCYPDLMEITVKADMFEIGAPIQPAELRLGVVYGHACSALESSKEEYKIVVGLSDCGTKHWMTESALVYTNLLIYTPATSEDGLIRMEEAVIPIECHYKRKYSLSSSPLQPTWIPFIATQSAVETLDFNLRVMTSDWLHERSSNVFHLSEPICLEASIRVGNHMDLRVFMSSCVATLYPARDSTPRYDFIENNGCLMDSQLQGAHSQFLPRTQDNKLRMVIDAFRFHQEEQGELYITCQLTATPVTVDAEKPMLQTKACTYMNGRWRSADGNDYLCGACGGQNEIGQPRSYGAFRPLIHANSAASSSWKSGLKEQVYDDEERVGPILVLPTKKSGYIPKEDVPTIISKMGSSVFHGSQWRSGMAPKMGMGSKKDLDEGLVPERLLPSFEQRVHKELNKTEKYVTTKQEEDKTSGDDEAVTTADVAQKATTLPSVPSDLPKPETQVPQPEGRAEYKNMTMMAQQTEEQKLLEEKKPKK